MAEWKTLDDVVMPGQLVLTRLDINVPIENGTVADDTRIRSAVETVLTICRRGAAPVLISHLGRPNGQPADELSLRQLVPTLEENFARPVRFCSQTIGTEARELVGSIGPGDICLLENLRFNPGETGRDPEFASELASMCDVYCNDAFSASHRAHASIVGVAQLLPSCAGRQLERELSALESALGSPSKPVMAIVGGSKISTKLGVLKNLMAKVDYLAIGGAMANTFLHAQGLNVGKSLVEPDLANVARDVMNSAERRGCEILLPVDVVVAPELRPGSDAAACDATDCPPDKMILDAGPKSVQTLLDALAVCRTLVWNGPVGAFEVKPFDRATNEIAIAAARLARTESLVSIAGGGDTVSALRRSGAYEDMTHVSTAGGAFLEWLEGKQLPGIAALTS